MTAATSSRFLHLPHPPPRPQREGGLEYPGLGMFGFDMSHDRLPYRALDLEGFGTPEDLQGQTGGHPVLCADVEVMRNAFSIFDLRG